MIVTAGASTDDEGSAKSFASGSEGRWRPFERDSGATSPSGRETIYPRRIGFDGNYEAIGIEHRLTEPNPPRTSRRVEWMDRRIKDATAKRFHHANPDQLRAHLADCNCARRVRTFGGIAPYEHICKLRTSQPVRFIHNPIHPLPN